MYAVSSGAQSVGSWSCVLVHVRSICGPHLTIGRAVSISRAAIWLWRKTTKDTTLRIVLASGLP